MPSFQRRVSEKWHREIPGARWLKCDIHLHTLDDYPSKRIRPPDGVSGKPTDEKTQEQYAREFLKAAISNNIQVLGLTPHAVKVDESEASSVVWQIVDLWNEGDDDDGIPFRDKIYTVFPGFEPNLSDGANGLHLLFLFDPEIGRTQYLSAFNAVMGGLPPYAGNRLQLSQKSASEAFDLLDDLQKRTDGQHWDYACFAPHAWGDHGLFKTLKAQRLSLFSSDRLTGIELKDDGDVEAAFLEKPWLKEGLRMHHHALYHSSDAYSVDEIGKRFFLAKLATPKIESLRQAFLASDSRLRVAFIRDDNGGISVAPDLPESIPVDRPWLKSVNISGGASFFGGLDSSGKERSVSFTLNPDFNCIIGARMSGKSTLVDGLRYHWEFPLPEDSNISLDIKGRAELRFASGEPNITAEICGPIASSLAERERWPAIFISQRELQRAAKDYRTLEQILFRLNQDYEKQLRQIGNAIEVEDGNLVSIHDEIVDAREELESVQAEFERALDASKSLESFSKAGLQGLKKAQADLAKIASRQTAAQEIKQDINDLKKRLNKLALPANLDLKLRKEVNSSGKQYDDILEAASASIEDAEISISALLDALRAGHEKSIEKERATHRNLIADLVRLGESPQKLSEFESLTELSANLAALKDERQEVRHALASSLRSLHSARLRRRALLSEKSRVSEQLSRLIEKEFQGAIRLKYGDVQDTDQLEKWVKGLGKKGVTRWWNDSDSSHEPDEILTAIRRGSRRGLGMSSAVWDSFIDAIDQQEIDELRTLRNSDLYEIEYLVDKDTETYRNLEQLSGGAQIGVLLAMLLQTEDNIPLVIDQPEDEINRAHLSSDLIPLIRALKGRKQIIFVTHDANIVVNGDADNVICLEADHERGWISECGAIDDTSVKDVVITLLDGGRDAFELRRLKYGY